MLNLDSFYKSVLEFAGCTVSDNGYIQCNNGKRDINVLVDGKELVFPTLEHQRNPVENTVMFHPLSESDIGAESKVLARLRDLVYLRFNMITMHVMNDLIGVINSTDTHSKLPASAKELLYRGIGVDKNSKVALMALVQDRKEDLRGLFVNNWSRKGGNVQGRQYSRASIVAFPLYLEIRKDPEEFAEKAPKKVRKNDPEAFAKLIEFIFPNCATPDSYYRGSDSQMAPYFESFLRSAKLIADDLQTVLDNFSGHLLDSAEYSFNTEWMSIAENVEVLKGQSVLIPMSNKAMIPQQEPVIAQQQVQPTNVNALAALLGGNTNAIPTPQQAAAVNVGGKRSITDLAASNSHLAANTMLQGNNMMQQSGNAALMALMSGGAPNASGMAALTQLLGAQQQQQQQLVQQLGQQGAAAVQVLMRQGMSQQDAVMQVLANRQPEPTQEQLLAQVLQQSMQPQNSQAALAAALGQALGNGNATIPQGYPQGDVVNIAGRNYLKVQTNIGGLQLIPL